MKKFKTLSEFILESKSKPLDDDRFDCNNYDELDYVVNRYVEKDRKIVRKFIIDTCNRKKFYHSTHKIVYQSIKDELGLDIPVDNPRG